MGPSSILTSKQLTSGSCSLKITPKPQSQMSPPTIQIFLIAFLFALRCSAQRASLRGAITGKSKWAATTSVDWGLHMVELTERVHPVAWAAIWNPGVWNGLTWSFLRGTTALRPCWRIQTPAVWASCWTAMREAQHSLTWRIEPMPFTLLCFLSLSLCIQLSGSSQMALISLCASSLAKLYTVYTINWFVILIRVFFCFDRF